MRLLTIVLLALLIFVSAFAVIVKNDDNGEAHAAALAPLTVGRINVTATLLHRALVRARPSGRQSDRADEAWRLTDKFGHPVGRMLLACRWVLPRARLCYGEITMPRGKISVSGSSATGFEGEYAVNGGTGAYDSGGGVMLFTAIGLRKTILLVIITT